MGEREGERDRERERISGLSQSESLFFPPISFHVMGLVLRRRNGTEKNTLLLLPLSLLLLLLLLCVNDKSVHLDGV